jgi:hypothetical protein
MLKRLTSFIYFFSEKSNAFLANAQVQQLPDGFVA